MPNGAIPDCKKRKQIKCEAKKDLTDTTPTNYQNYKQLPQTTYQDALHTNQKPPEKQFKDYPSQKELYVYGILRMNGFPHN